MKPGYALGVGSQGLCFNMIKVTPFDAYHQCYDNWFLRHTAAWQSELLAVRALLPWKGLGLEIGVGTGRFAGPLGIMVGIDPSRNMLNYALQRGIAVVQGKAEALPFQANCFDYVLSVTTLCFVDDVSKALSEVHRVLMPGGELVIGFIDRSSKLGQGYLKYQTENVFYQNVKFFSAIEVEQLLLDASFSEPVWIQTLTKPLEQIQDIEPGRAGFGDSAFIVVRVTRPDR